MQEEKKYRPNVAAIVLSPKYPNECEFFIAERLDLRNVWQFPQGGIDSGESAREALHRELLEEIGTSDIEIIAEYPEWLSYDFPPNIANRMKPYHGQKQKYFLVRLKTGSVINIDTEVPEFCRYEFVDFETLLTRMVSFKRHVYLSALHYFKKEGHL